MLFAGILKKEKHDFAKIYMYQDSTTVLKIQMQRMENTVALEDEKQRSVSKMKLYQYKTSPTARSFPSAQQVLVMSLGIFWSPMLLVARLRGDNSLLILLILHLHCKQHSPASQAAHKPHPLCSPTQLNQEPLRKLHFVKLHTKYILKLFQK